MLRQVYLEALEAWQGQCFHDFYDGKCSSGAGRCMGQPEALPRGEFEGGMARDSTRSGGGRIYVEALKAWQGQCFHDI